MTAPAKPIAAVDVPLSRLESDLRALLAHPPATRHATDGEAAEMRHLLYDADPDDTTRPFVDLRKGTAA